MSLVSVIIPTFNRESTLARALDSVAAQTFRDLELIVVDDGSKDATQALVLSHPYPVKYIRTENRGVSAARNRGLRMASSPWIAFLDSDDSWLPRKLEKQLELRHEFALIHGEELWIRNGVRVNAMKKHAKSGGRLFQRCVDLCCISPSTALIRADLLNEGFREDFPVCEDYELWLRLSARHEVGFIAEPVIQKHGGHADQLSRRYPAMDYFRVKALAPFLTSLEISPEERNHVASTMVQKCNILCRGYTKHSNFTHWEEVQAWRDKANNCLAQNHSAYSVAERRPRSLSKLSL